MNDPVRGKSIWTYVVEASTVLALFAAVFLTDKIREQLVAHLPDYVSSYWVPVGQLVAGIILVVLGYRRRDLLTRLCTTLWGVFKSVGRILLMTYTHFLRLLLRPVLSQPQLAEGTQPRKKLHYGDRVLFRHFTTGRYLTSLQGHNNTGPLSSGQQMTFGAPVPDEHSIWVLCPTSDRKLDDFKGQQINSGDVIRMRHESTHQFLHSHSSPSPSERSDPSIEKRFALNLGFQREVTVSLHNNVQDHWHIDPVSKFEIHAKCRFRHNDGVEYLHSHNRTIDISGRAGCYEVTTCRDRNDDDLWVVTPVALSPEIAK
jgi:dolichyl-phosphate-mannose--protein O-mannosyl transferase